MIIVVIAGTATIRKYTGNTCSHNGLTPEAVSIQSRGSNSLAPVVFSVNKITMAIVRICN